MKKQYIVVKETPELKKGAIVEEECDDIEQGYECITKNLIKHSDRGVRFHRKVVEQQPEWFEEIEMIAVSKGLTKKVRAYIKKLQK